MIEHHQTVLNIDVRTYEDEEAKSVGRMNKEGLKVQQ
jgi:hypothetical protein